MRRLLLVISLSVMACCGVERGIEAQLHGAEEEEQLTMIIPGPRTRAVDVLLLIDDAPSMAAVQATLAANYDAFIGVLEADDVAADYRLGVVDGSGRLSLESCRGHQGDFQDPQVGCLDICPLEPGELSEVAVPWIERTTGVSNLPPGVSSVDALRCAGPIGSSGVSQRTLLERVERVLLAALDEGQPEYGFLRADADLIVLLITDGDDASSSEEGELREVPEFRALLDGVEAMKTVDLDSPRVIVSLVAAVESDGEPDDECGETTPDRLVSLARDGQGPQDWSATSVCGEDYSSALEPIADKIRDQIRPACFPAQVVSAAPDGEPFEPDCVTIERRGDGAEHELPTCGSGGEVPEGQPACVEYLTEAARDQLCIDDGHNVELRIYRPEGQPMARGGFYLATCGIEVDPGDGG